MIFLNPAAAAKSLSRIWLFATPWTVARQAPLPMGFSRQEYWSGLPFPSPGDLPDPGIKPRSSALQADALTSEPRMRWILDWVAIPFSRTSSQPRNWTGVSCITGGFFTNWAIMLSTVTIQIRADTDNSNGANNKESVCQCRRYKRHRFHFWTRKIAWRRDGNPLQYSCLENLMDKGAWQATVHGVKKSRKRLITQHNN